MAKINFLALGGLDNHGKNMYVLEIDENIIVFDGGTEKPSSKIHGVKTVMADTNWLKTNAHKIKGVFLSNYQEDHMSAVPFLLRYVPGLKVYGSRLTLVALKSVTKRDNIRAKAELIPVSTHKKVEIANGVRVKFFKITSQTLGHYGFVVETPDGNIIYATDFVYSNETTKSFAHDLNKLPLISKNNLLLLVGSRYGKYSGFTAPHHKVTGLISPTIRGSHNKIYIGAYDRDMYSIFEAIKTISSTGRPICFTNPLTERLIKEAVANKLISLGGIKLVPANEIESYPNCACFITDEYAKLYSTISAFAKGNKFLDFKNGDTFIMMAPPIPGNESQLSETIDDVYKKGMKVLSISEKQRKFMWASEEDIKTLVSLTNPKYAIPVRGLYRDLSNACNYINDCGIDNDKILLLDNGDVASFHGGQLQQKPDFKVKLQEKYIEGNGVSSSPTVVINERNSLAENGAITVSFMISREKEVLASTIDIRTKGFMELEEKLIDYLLNLKEQIRDVIIQLIKEKETTNDLKKRVKNFVTKRFVKEFDKEPVVLVAMTEI